MTESVEDRGGLAAGSSHRTTNLLVEIGKRTGSHSGTTTLETSGASYAPEFFPVGGFAFRDEIYSVGSTTFAGFEINSSHNSTILSGYLYKTSTKVQGIVGVEDT
jgi:hypothetical protein